MFRNSLPERLARQGTRVERKLCTERRLTVRI